MSILCYEAVNTTFRDGIENTFTVGNVALRNVPYPYPIYMAYEDNSTGFLNVLLQASFDQGKTWTAPIQVNDNANPNVDEFQPQLAVAPDGTVSVNFYDRRLACPAKGTKDAIAAGLALDRVNPNFSGSLPPYGAANYCINSSIQFYTPTLQPIGHNIRLTKHPWDGQLNGPHPSNALDVGFPTGYTFIGDHFGNDIGPTGVDFSTFVSTFDDGSNPQHRQQQVVATIAAP